MKSRNIKLHIEELVLHGFEQGVQQSLNRGGKIEHLDSWAFEAAQGSKPEAIGAKVAKAVYGGLNR